MLLCLPSILTSKTVFLMWWWLETGCWGGNLVKWGCEGEVLMRELMFSYKKRGNKAILPWTCEDIGRRSQSMSLGFTGSASQTMRRKCILCPVGGIFFSSQGRLTQSPWHPCPLVMWNPWCLSCSSYISKGCKEKRNLEWVRLVPLILLSEECHHLSWALNLFETGEMWCIS